MLRKKASTQLIRSGLKGLIFFPIYAPWTVDTQEEAILPESLALTAHDFIASGRAQNVDVEHNGVKVDAAIVESFMSIPEDPRFPIPQTWAGAMRLHDSGLISAVEMGIVNGVSFEIETDPSSEGGLAVTRTRYPMLVSCPTVATGATEPPIADAIAPHVHSINLEFDQDSRIIPTRTGETDGHWHSLFYSTATEIAQGHTHRVDFFKLQIEYVSRLQIVTLLSQLRVIAISLVEHGANWMPFVGMKTAREVIGWPAR